MSNNKDKKKMLTLLCVLGGVLLAGIIAFVIISLVNDTADEAFSCVTVSVGENGERDRNICWITDDSDKVSLIQIKKGTDETFKSGTYETIEGFIESVVRSAPPAGKEESSNPTLKEKKMTRHIVYLDGLEPGCTYTYRVGNGKKWSHPGHFTTGDGKTDFSFLIFSDSQGFGYNDMLVWKTVYEKAYAEYGRDAAFSVMLGDTVENQHNLQSWIYATDNVNGLGNTVCVPCAGNKDDDLMLAYFTPGAQGRVTGYYSFNYGKVHFSVLYTADNSKTLAKGQLKWLVSDLSSAAAQDADYRVVIMHKAPYSDGNHCFDTEIVEIASQTMGVFEKYNVDVVLEGHDHYYFRSVPVLESGTVAGDYNVEDVDGVSMYSAASGYMGPIYFMGGASGCKQHSGTLGKAGVLAASSQLTKQPTYTYVTVSEGKMIFYTYLVDRSTGTQTLLEAWGLA